MKHSIANFSAILILCAISIPIHSAYAFETPVRTKGLPHPPVEVWPQLVVGGKEDPALGYIEQYQKEHIQKPYGDVLDAGTGIYSLRWLAGLLYRHSNPDDALFMRSYVAVTADINFRKECQAKAEELGISEWGEVCLGNWAAGYEHAVEVKGEGGEQIQELCKDRMFDTILADYLVGAVDFFAPFFQDQLFHKLKRHLRPGGTLFVTGLNPIPEKADGDADLFCRVTKLRDACILLTRSRPYREHPPDWVVRHLESAGLNVVDVAKFPKKYCYSQIKTQIEATRSTLPFIPNDQVREVMKKQIDELDLECKEVCEKSPEGGFVLGFDWVIIATN